MGTFIAEVERARGTIGEHTEAIRRVFAANDIPAASLNPIGEIEAWIDARLPELRRRNQLALQMSTLPTWLPGSPPGVVAYPEKPVLPTEEARRLGRELADRYREIKPNLLFDEPDEKCQKVLEELAAHVEDPEFTAAFFGALGTSRSLQLSRTLQRGQVGKQSAVEVVSRAFSTAVSGGSTAEGFSAVSRNLLDPAKSSQDLSAIGNLLSSGRFPTEWLAQVAAAQVLRRGSTADGETLTPYLRALAKDPAAARLAIRLVTKNSSYPPPPNIFANLIDGADLRLEFAPFLSDFSGRAARHPTSADAFGQLLASASGAYDEAAGKHSEKAARFAFELITSAKEIKFPAPARVHLSEIAGSYAQEMTEGADLGDDNQLMPSAFGKIHSRIPGLNPLFRLNPKDAYLFVKSFADSDANLLPFEAGMGNLARSLIDVETQKMMKTKDPTRLDNVFAVLGNVRGFELAAAEQVRKVMDDKVEADKKAFSVGSGTVFGLVGFAVPGGVLGAAFWTMISTGWSAYDTYKPDSENHVDKLRKSEELQTIGRRHAIAQALMDAGSMPEIPAQNFQAFDQKQMVIVDGGGRLRSFDEIAIKQSKDGKPAVNQEGLQALDQWLIANGMGSNKVFVFGNTVARLSRSFDGGKAGTQARALSFDD